MTRLYNDALERERDAVRAAQEQTEAVNQKLKALEDAIDRTAFVLVLVDADADAYLVGATSFSSNTQFSGSTMLTWLIVWRPVLSR